MKIYSCDLVGFHSFNTQVMTDFIFLHGHNLLTKENGLPK